MIDYRNEPFPLRFSVQTEPLMTRRAHQPAEEGDWNHWQSEWRESDGLGAMPVVETVFWLIVFAALAASIYLSFRTF